MQTRPVTAALAVFLSMSPAAALAQSDEFEFGEEDFDEEGGGMTFEEEGEDEGGEAEGGQGVTFESSEEDAAPRTVVLIIHSPGAEPELAQRVTDALEKYVSGAGRNDVVDSDEFRAQLFGPGEAAAMDCATNAVCLSGYAGDLWIDSVVIGVLYRGEGGWKIETNSIDVRRAEVESYASHDDTALNRRSGQDLSEIARRMGAKLLGLSMAVDSDKPRTKVVHRRGPIQTRLAWGTGALATAALGTAVILGFQARSKQSELQKDDLAQVAAPKLIDEGRQKARNANIFLGLALAAGAGSAALFFIKPQQEVEIAPQGPTPGFGDGDLDASRSPLIPDSWGLGISGVTATWSLP